MSNVKKEDLDQWWIDDVMEEFQLFNIKHHWMPNAIGMWPNECECFLWCAINAPEGDWLEIGSFCGGSAVLLNLLGSHTYRTINCVDIKFSNVFYHNIHTMGKFYETILHECDSSDLRQHYEGDKISFAFIDGFHSYKQVLKDFIEIEPLLVKDSIVAFHDVSPNMWNDKYRTKLINDSYKYDATIHDWNDDSEDFRLDEAVASIIDRSNQWEWLDIPVKNEETHFDETHLTEWVRGKTSPFTSLCAIRKIA